MLSLDERVRSNAAALGFDVLPVGVIPANPQELISSLQFKKMLRDLSERYDRVIIDSPPVGIAGDSMMVGGMVDAVALVCRYNQTRKSLVKMSVRRLADVGVAEMRMLVDADNKPVLFLYKALGANFEPYDQAGVPTVQVWFDVPRLVEERPCRWATQGEVIGR